MKLVSFRRATCATDHVRAGALIARRSTERVVDVAAAARAAERDGVAFNSIAAMLGEGELRLVIGCTCSRVTEKEALEYVSGYLCLNDVTGRTLDPGSEHSPEFLQRATFFDWLIGKRCDTFCRPGPCLVTTDDVPDATALTLVAQVDRKELQRTSTGEMIHSISRTNAWCGGLMTLEPGDIIAAGPPAGVGSSTGRFLRVGDVVEVEIEGLGTLRNPVAA